MSWGGGDISEKYPKLQKAQDHFIVFATQSVNDFAKAMIAYLVVNDECRDLE